MAKRLTHMSYWTALVARYSQEQRAAHHVERQGFEFYLPQMLALSASGRDRRELLFPGYIFVRVNLRRQWRVLAGTRGVARMLLCGELPTRVPDEDVEAFRRLEDERGFVQLLPPLRDGDVVVAGSGSGGYEGVRGVVQGMTARDRVKVLLTILGRAVSVELDRRALSLT